MKKNTLYQLEDEDKSPQINHEEHQRKWRPTLSISTLPVVRGPANSLNTLIITPWLLKDHGNSTKKMQRDQLMNLQNIQTANGLSTDKKAQHLISESNLRPHSSQAMYSYTQEADINPNIQRFGIAENGVKIRATQNVTPRGAELTDTSNNMAVKHQNMTPDPSHVAHFSPNLTELSPPSASCGQSSNVGLDENSEIYSRRQNTAVGGTDEDTIKSSTSFDDDGSVEEATTNELSTFDFCHISRKATELTEAQCNYKTACHIEGILPNALLLNSLPTSAIVMNSQRLGTKGIKTLCTVLTTTPTVNYLGISQDQIDLQAMTYLAQLLLEKQEIRKLDLSDNNMGRQPVRLLIQTIQVSDSIVSLNLSGNQLEDSDADIFVSYFRETYLLENLNLSCNRFGNTAAAVLGKSLADNCSITCLSLRWNQIKSKGALLFLTCMEKNKWIQRLDISWNGLGNIGTSALVKMLKKNKILEHLDVSATRINDTSLLNIAGVLKKNKTLRSLTIGNNTLSMNGISTFLKQISLLKGNLTLKDLDFGSHNISIETVSVIRKLFDEKDIIVRHGTVVGLKSVVDSDIDVLATLNPVTILTEFARLLGTGLRDLFQYIDKDKSGTLTRQEIKDGLMEFDIPLPNHSLDMMIRKLDRDGDGDITFQDFMASEPEEVLGRKNKTIFKKEFERERCRKILKRLMARHNNKKEDSDLPLGMP